MLSLTEISTGTETNGICFHSPPFPSWVPRGWGRGGGQVCLARGGHSLLRQCRAPGGSAVGSNRLLSVLQSLSLVKKRETEGTAQLRTRKERKLAAERRVQQEGSSVSCWGPTGAELSAPRRLPRLGPGPRAGAGAALPFKTLFPVLLHHAPSDWALLARRPCSVPCRRHLSPVRPSWNRPQLRTSIASTPPPSPPEPHASTHRALARVGGWPLLSSCVVDAGFRGRRAP